MTADLRKYNHAIALADTGSFVRASERLHLTQSALTRSIQALEKELGIKLFDRGKQGVKPTQDGYNILNRARALLLHGRTLENEIKLIKEIAIGDTAFGVGPALPPLFLSGLLISFNLQHPGLGVEVFLESPPRLLEKLRNEQIEFFVSGIDQLQLENADIYHSQLLTRIQVQFFARKNHPLFKMESTSISDLQNFTLAATQLHSNSQSALRFNEQIPKPKIFCNDLPSMRQLLLNSDVVMFGLNAMVAEELAEGTVRPLSLKGLLPIPPSNISLVTLAERTPSRASKKITTWIENFFNHPPKMPGEN